MRTSDISCKFTSQSFKRRVGQSKPSTQDTPTHLAGVVIWFRINDRSIRRKLTSQCRSGRADKRWLPDLFAGRRNAATAVADVECGAASHPDPRIRESMTHLQNVGLLLLQPTTWYQLQARCRVLGGGATENNQPQTRTRHDPGRGRDRDTNSHGRPQTQPRAMSKAARR